MSMSKAKCCVPGCAESGDSHRVLHGFPNPVKEPDRFRSWIFTIGGDIVGLSNEYIYTHRRVCHSHFEDKHCCRFNRISKIAVPRLNLMGLSTIPRFTWDERRPLRNTLNLQEDVVPCTSQGSATDAVPNEGFNQEINAQKVAPKCLDKKGSATDAVPNQGLNQEINTQHDAPNFLYKKDTCKRQRTVPAVRKRIRRVKMSVNEQTLYTEVKKLKMKISKYKNKVKKQSAEIRAAKNIMSNPNFLNAIEKWSSAAKIFMFLQMREIKKKEKGHRFNVKEKILALTLLKQSPKAYRFLRKIFILPAPQTLIIFLNKAALKPGINEKVFAQLRLKASKMKNHENLCVLLFDEVALKVNLTYNERKDQVSGFVTDGKKTEQVFADHAQVFMIRGLIKNYKQPVAYTFSRGATKGLELAKQIKEVIKELQKAGFRVLATVCDQGANNRAAINRLVSDARGVLLREGKNPNDNVFIIEKQEIVAIFDPPHLLKGIRNNLLTKNLKYDIDKKQGTAKWEHLQLLYHENPGWKGLRLIPKLTESHIIPKKIGKMKVKFASQVFSATVAASMGYLSDLGVLPKESQETAVILLFFDKLFDSVNGSYAKKDKHGKPYLGPVRPSSIHHELWNEGKKCLKKMKFVTKSGKEEFVPTLRNWVMTLEGVELLTKKLKDDYDISSVWMRHLNQDPLENFFGAIRSHGCRNTNPTPERFESAFATLLVNNLTSVHAPGANCEKDYGEALHALVINEDCKANTPSQYEVDMDDVMNINLTAVASKTDPKIIAPLTYVTGYFVREAKRKISKNCKTCQRLMQDDEGQHEYIKKREYAGRNWLHNPSSAMIEIISNIQDICSFLLQKSLQKKLLKEYVKTIILILVDLNFLNCTNHKDLLKKHLINLVVKFFIYNYCKDINKILYGRRGVDDRSDYLQVEAHKYYLKSIKIKK